jgi:hypothetical protein
MDSPPPYQEHLPPADYLNLGFQCGSHMPKCSKPPFGSSSFVEPGLLAANHKERKLWLCPHLGMSFTQTKELFSALPVAKSADKSHKPRLCLNNKCNLGILHSLFASTVNDDRVGYQLNTNILLLPAQEIAPQSETYEHIFTLQRVAEALHRLDIPLCPHVRLNQSIILAGYNPRCRFTLKDMTCPCSHTTRPEVSSRSCQRHQNLCPHTLCCTSCRNDDLSTIFVLHVIEDTQSIKGPKHAALALLISRDLGNLENASHTAWLSASVQAHEFESITSVFRDWQQDNDHQKRKCLQDSACPRTTKTASALWSSGRKNFVSENLSENSKTAAYKKASSPQSQTRKSTSR